MKYEDPKNVDLDELPEVAVYKKRGFSIVWIIPKIPLTHFSKGGPKR